MTRFLSTLVFVSLVLGCLDAGEGSQGLKATPDGTGAVITWDLDATPLPDIPFPNDIATRLDPSSPTGRRVNVSLEADTAFERDLREKADGLSGFGIFSPSTIGFSKPIDLCNIAARQHNDEDWTNDVAYLVAVTEGPHFGEVVPMDFGRGYFPNQLEKREYFDGDLGGENLMLQDEALPDCTDASWEYDKNTFYEFETNTLILRPMMPLREMVTYALVITDRLVDADGKSVRSPFPFINHVRQTAALSGLGEALSGAKDLDGASVNLATSLDDVAFAWTFTTQEVTRTLHDLRRGLYGHGPFAAIAEEYPLDETALTLHELFDDATDLPGNPYVLKWTTLEGILANYIDQLLDGTAEPVDLLATYKYVDYLIMGEVEAPSFLVDREGIAKDAVPCTGDDDDPDTIDVERCQQAVYGDDDEIFDLDRQTGEAVYGPQRITFWCAIPKKDRKVRDGPFPVAFYGHGYTSGRLEMLGFAGNHARHGIASCAIDAFGHGVAFDPSDLQPRLVRAVFAGGGIGPAVNSIIPGRARDVNGDGAADAGGDFWTADAFHTRDIVRQSVLDHSAVLKVLRSFDGRPGMDMDGDGTPELAGDFDADGEIDLGGPDNSYYAWGQSLGGILSAIWAGVEPHLVAAAPTSGAAGLFDVGIRSRQGGVSEAVWLPLMGPLFYGRPLGDGTTRVEMIVSDFNKKAQFGLGIVEGAAAGDEVVLENLSTGHERSATIRDDGTFRTSIGVDAMNATEKLHHLGLRAQHPENPFYRTEAPATIEDTTAVFNRERLGDLLRITVCSGACDASRSNTRKVIDTFELTNDAPGASGPIPVDGIYYQGTVYKKGQPLIAVADGFGYERQTPDLRRLRGIAGFIAEPGDPVAYSRFYTRDVAEWRARWQGETEGTNIDFGTHVLNIATLGDMNVPVNTGVMISWSSGIMELGELSRLRDNYVLEAVEDVRSDVFGAPVLFDIDNLSNGTDGFMVDGVPSPHPAPGQELRVRYTDPNGRGVHGLRLPAILPRGDHGFLVPDAGLPFDIHSFMAHQISRYFITGGSDLRDDACMHDQSCAWMPE